MASYSPPRRAGRDQPASRASPDITGSVAPEPVGHWTWDGGTPVTVAHGDTVDTIARRYGVPPSAIMQANNLTPHGTLRPASGW